MGLVNKISTFGSLKNNDSNTSSEGLVNKRSIFVPLKFSKYDPTLTKSLGGSPNFANFSPPAPEPPTPTPPPPLGGAFSNAFSNAFDI